MQKLKTILQINNLVLIGAILIALVFSIDTFQSISKNYQLEQEYDKLQAQIDVQKLANKNLELNNQYLESNDYLELAVREKLDKGAPGDKELIFTNLPAAKHKQVDSTKPREPGGRFDKYRQNLDDWINFLLHRKSKEQ